ncbi:MAG: transglycosylase domain-containing protein [Alphaproteobacteria bacterium]|nr:transglycosylase domain-containing protein [Alphaproteobacteria bacterium]
MRLSLKKTAIACAGIALFAVLLFGVMAGDLPNALEDLTARTDKLQFVDRSGEPLNASYQNYWNVSDVMALHEMPPLLIQLFIAAEDKNFYSHSGVDWRARFAALWQNVRAGKVIRGASSLSEQVVRMIVPRRRTFFSKLLETVDVWRLERRFLKNDILEFYLNQVPYAANRRGIKQASRFYFSKTPDRLSIREMTALIVLVRAPTSFDLYRAKDKIDASINRQLQLFFEQGLINENELNAALREKMTLVPPALTIQAPHFLEYVRSLTPEAGKAVETTLDAFLQKKAAELTLQRLKDLKYRHVSNAAVLIADRRTGEILAWVSETINPDTKAINAVLVPRQPASAQKPLLYGVALTKGMTAATKIKDSPFSKAVGQGVHHFKNYSRTYYGDVTLRQALGNSLNIPALKTIEFIGYQTYYDFLKNFGFVQFDKPADFYREGLALGNAEMTLFSLTQAYLMLANGGMTKSLRVYKAQEIPAEKRALPETAASLIGHILSDPLARQWEFGTDSVLNFPVQTAVKTGTSTGYRDAWAMGYNRDFVAGVWFGNLNYEPMSDVTGAAGPALLLRSIFTELNKIKTSGALELSPELEKRTVDGKTEYFDPNVTETYRIEAPDCIVTSPENGVMLAIDPRIPPEYQQYPFSVSCVPEGASVVWNVDGKEVWQGRENTFLWRISRGSHTVRAAFVGENFEKQDLPEQTLIVR